jgi:hypothetical protein
MLRPAIKIDCRHAYVSLVILVTILIVLLTVAVHAQVHAAGPGGGVLSHEQA